LSIGPLDWQLACLVAMQSANGPNSMINAHTDLQAALREIHGIQSQALVNNSSGSEFPALRLATSTPGWPMARWPRPPSRKPLPTETHEATKKVKQTLPLRNVSLIEAQEPKPLSVQQRCQVALVDSDRCRTFVPTQGRADAHQRAR